MAGAPPLAGDNGRVVDRGQAGQPEGSALRSRYAAFVCDLDGVVYRGEAAVPYAVAALEGARSAGVRVVYVTNNASRPAAEVAAQLRELGLRTDDGAVVTSSQAGAEALAARLPPGARVLAVGGPGVALALDRAGLVPVRVVVGPDGRSEPVAPVAGVLQGWGRDVSWQHLAEVAYAVTQGAVWVATNGDATLPTARGVAPGNGALVGAVRHAVHSDPLVVGKPNPPLYELAAAAAGAAVSETLAIGDRLDTDVLGAAATRMDALHVLTGVHGLRELCQARGGQRPRYVAWDLRVLAADYQPARVAGSKEWRCGRARLCWDGTGPRIGAEGSREERLRVMVAAAWAMADEGRAEEVGAVDWDDVGSRLGS